MEDRLLRRRQVEETAGLSRSSIYRLMAKWRLPSARQDRANCRQVEGEDIATWLESLHVAGYEIRPPHPD